MFLDGQSLILLICCPTDEKTENVIFRTIWHNRSLVPPPNPPRGVQSLFQLKTTAHSGGRPLDLVCLMPCFLLFDSAKGKATFLKVWGERPTLDQIYGCSPKGLSHPPLPASLQSFQGVWSVKRRFRSHLRTNHRDFAHWRLLKC